MLAADCGSHHVDEVRQLDPIGVTPMAAGEDESSRSDASTTRPCRLREMHVGCNQRVDVDLGVSVDIELEVGVGQVLREMSDVGVGRKTIEEVERMTEWEVLEQPNQVHVELECQLTGADCESQVGVGREAEEFACVGAMRMTLQQLQRLRMVQSTDTMGVDVILGRSLMGVRLELELVAG